MNTQLLKGCDILQRCIHAISEQPPLLALRGSAAIIDRCLIADLSLLKSRLSARVEVAGLHFGTPSGASRSDPLSMARSHWRHQHWPPDQPGICHLCCARSPGAFTAGIVGARPIRRHNVDSTSVRNCCISSSIASAVAPPKPKSTLPTPRSRSARRSPAMACPLSGR